MASAISHRRPTTLLLYLLSSDFFVRVPPTSGGGLLRAMFRLSQHNKGFRLLLGPLPWPLDRSADDDHLRGHLLLPTTSIPFAAAAGVARRRRRPRGRLRYQRSSPLSQPPLSAVVIVATTSGGHLQRPHPVADSSGQRRFRWSSLLSQSPPSAATIAVSASGGHCCHPHLRLTYDFHDFHLLIVAMGKSQKKEPESSSSSGNAVTPVKMKRTRKSVAPRDSSSRRSSVYRGVTRSN
ncbi:hypothetical protein ZIOFF_073901 [Zingiber officinale]|uniref:Uncharacterized protein n=1 Tax=Zingiber officinale TaxID=94328 RepID=A0A8J5C1V0_ZINOF|nr:hypothetical protein ZIOFF_073901 [Zingiber officinale]